MLHPLATIRERLAEIVRSHKPAVVALADAPSIAGVGKIASDLVAGLVAALRQADATGAEKKAAALESFGHWFDTDIEPIDLPGPDWIEDPALRLALLWAAGIAIDAVVSSWSVPGGVPSGSSASLNELQDH